MPKPNLFDPHEYRELTFEDQALLHRGYHKAIEALRRNITPMGFSACSLADNSVSGTDVNYRSVWARDGAKTVIWTLDLDDEDIRACQAQTLRTILGHQAPAGQLPAHVLIDTDEPEYGGVGGITAIDGALWILIAVWRYSTHTGDYSILDEHADVIHRAIQWLGSLDSNNCGLLEIPEAGDWTDLYARSYHVLYDEVLWHRCLICYSQILGRQGNTEQQADYAKWAEHVGSTILKKFWPSTAVDHTGVGPSFAEVQYKLGDSRYLVAQISPFGYSWRCDVYGNLLAYLTNLVSDERAKLTFQFLWGIGVNEPGPVKNTYPPIHAGDPEWRDYFTVNLLNLPNHYHNGGIWPFIGGLWVRYINKLGHRELARRELVKLAQLCSHGSNFEWEFNEWHHGVTGRPMGKAFQAWSAASFIKACHALHLDPESMEHQE
ncbi:amylo-alpha-1,6-glucosidase [Lignipirellula cremea]|uniref:beta-fructofuranosidase n=1 Tax=Lignipirellula cremea TaxID=2528010 RepID=A0A518DUA7_9BACT|nr:glycoside hydrolase 100 family protein [Lignipirellula cremea]QDU95417.1 Plant neutral invertase [Lignipirellula cremea]